MADPQERARRRLRANLEHVLQCPRQLLLGLIGQEPDPVWRAGLWGIHDTRLLHELLYPSGTNPDFLSPGPLQTLPSGHPLKGAWPPAIERLLEACDPRTATIAEIDLMLRRLKPDSPHSATKELDADARQQAELLIVYLRGCRAVTEYRQSFAGLVSPSTVPI